MPNMNEQVGSSWDHVNPGYLEALGETILRGRSVTEQDTATTAEHCRGKRSLCEEIFQAR